MVVRGSNKIFKGGKKKTGMIKEKKKKVEEEARTMKTRKKGLCEHFRQGHCSNYT